MSDAPREEEIYQALAPGGSYKSGLVNPVAAQQETTVSVPMRFKGAMGGGAVGNDDYPDHEPRASVPYKHYKDLEDVDPKLHEAVTHVADEIHIPRTDLASLVYANSEYNPNARNGARTGYMGLTPDDARQLDPEGHLDINDPIDNLFMGAMKYKRISNRFGMGTPNAFAAYHGGGDRVHNLLEQDPDEHRRMAPDGTFDFLNKVLGRDGEGSGSSAPPAEDPGGGGDTPELSGAQLRGPQSFPDSWAPMSRARNMEPGREEALMRPQGPVAPPPDDTGLAARLAPPAGPSSSYGGDDAGWQRPAPPRPPPATDARAATAGIERAIGAQRGQPPVPPPPSGDRMIPGVGNPNQVDIQRALTDPAYRESIMPTTSGPGAPYAPPPTRLPAEQQPGQVFDVSGARAAVGAVRQGLEGSPQEEAVARGVPVEQVMRERAARVPAPPPARDLEGQRAQAYTGELPPPPPPSSQPPGDTDWQRPIPPRPPGPPVDDTNWQRPMPSPELTGQGGYLQPAPVQPHTPEDTRPQVPSAPPDTSGGYAVGGAIGSGVRQYAGQPAVPPDQQDPAATTGSGAPPAPPRGPAPGQAIGTDSMAAQLNQQELARVQGGRPDVAPTGPTQAPAPTSTAAADAARDARAPTTPESVARMQARAETDPEYARELSAQVTANTESSNPALTAARASAAQAPAEPGAYTAIGDSLAAHVIRKGGVRGKEDATKVGSYREGDTAVSGWGTADVLKLIDKIPLGQIQGQNVVLSTGASNSPADLAAIPKQIARLKELGAKSVSVLGVGTRPDFAGVNDKLAGFVAGAKDPSVVFAGALPNVGADKVHSTDPASVFRSAQQALSKAGGGPATATTGSGGPTPTTAPSAGGDTGPAANLPAGAPKALAPPGSAPTPTSAPPIDRLSGNGGTMTPASAVRAGAQGPGGVLTHIARNGPRGMSMGEGWDHFQDLLERAMIMKGDINGLQHAQEYVFRMKHKGAMENMMQAIASMDDPETAVRFLAKSHAFVTDGTAIGFQVLNNQIYGQKYDEQTHDKIGKPFQVTEAGLRKLALAYSPPDKFNAALNQERTTNETGRHNRKTEQHADEQLVQQEAQSKRALEEKQIEYRTTQQRLADQAAQRAHEHATATQQRQDLADQQERIRRDLAADADRKARELQADRLAQQQEQAAQRAADAADKEAQRRADREATAAQRAAEEKAGHAKYADDATDEYFGRGGMAGAATDHTGQPYKGSELTKARTIFSGMLHHDKTISGGPEAAMDYTRGYLSGRYKMAESVNEKGERFAHIRDEDGNVLATVPSTIWRMYLPKQGTVPGGAKAK